MASGAPSRPPAAVAGKGEPARRTRRDQPVDPLLGAESPWRAPATENLALDLGRERHLQSSADQSSRLVVRRLAQQVVRFSCRSSFLFSTPRS
jgi:hypothetical protein